MEDVLRIVVLKEVDIALAVRQILEAHQSREGGQRSPVVGGRIQFEGEDCHSLVVVGEVEAGRHLLHSLFARSIPKLRGRLLRL